MSAKRMKELRKVLGYHPRNKRDYEIHEFPTTGLVAQVTEDGKVSVVEKEVYKPVVECVSPDRKFYKFLKKKMRNIEHEESLSHLPSKDALKELTEEIIAMETNNKEDSNE